jgi:hypothetical protein
MELARRVVLVAAVVTVLAGAGCAEQRRQPTGLSAPVTLPSGAAPTSESPEPAPTAESPAPAPSPSKTSAKPKPSTEKKKAPKVASTSKAPVADKDRPPAPPPVTAAPGCKPTYKGDKVSKQDVDAVLTEAAGRAYSASVPDLRVPEDLVKAIAWQESGWQSNIYACDGGVGLMQVMPATADFVNLKYRPKNEYYDIDKYRDNAFLGANYLAWLIKYFGEAYLGKNYVADPAACENRASLCLLNMIISAYNRGYGTVERSVPNGKLDDAALRYVDNVRSLMETKPWTKG